jgi:hypothetical protein
MLCGPGPGDGVSLVQKLGDRPVIATGAAMVGKIFPAQRPGRCDGLIPLGSHIGG